MDSTRQLKVNELLKRELSGVLQLKGVRCFGPELVSVTRKYASAPICRWRVCTLSVFPTDNKSSRNEGHFGSQQQHPF